LLQLETQFGRVRGQRWGARTLDLDLLLYGDRILDTPQLQLPHPRMGDRAFVLVPLAEIAPDWRHPVAGQSVEQLRCKIDCSDVRLAAS
jgi:2-amino-4-hydroxy-6-hydroxymethyldihydropteridine diphosphokinase